jgi:serine protein kinase
MAPKTLEFLAESVIASRLRPHSNSTMFSKIRVYNGEDIRESDTRAKSINEYLDAAGLDEGFEGLSTRFAYKVLSKTFNSDSEEISADPIRLILTLEDSIRREQFPVEKQNSILSYVQEQKGRYLQFLEKEIQQAYVESYGEFGQNMFDRYIQMADFWIQEKDLKDTQTGLILNRSSLNTELERLEKPAGIVNTRDFRSEVVNFVLRFQAQNGGKNPAWTSYSKLKEVIQANMFSSLNDVLPVISFDTKRDSEIAAKHDGFVKRMGELGYTPKQTRVLVEYFVRSKHSN